LTGWVVFGVLLAVCSLIAVATLIFTPRVEVGGFGLPLRWLGFLCVPLALPALRIQEKYTGCRRCGRKLL
jgi:hypothetical protein